MRTVAALAAFFLVGSQTLWTQEPAKSDNLVARLGANRGICVVLGDASGRRTLSLARDSSFVLYVQLNSSDDVHTLRQRMDQAGLYGTRVYVEQGDYRRIHLADNLADALVAVGDATNVERREVLRVLRPRARALIGDQQFVKPVPEGVDDWSHPLHGPDNNPQSCDQSARAPYLTQFLSAPLVGPHPQLTVASGGRVFKVYGSLVRHADYPGEARWQNKLVAINAYNGTIEWKRELDPEFPMNRRTLIATPDTLFFGDGRSCKLIDPATGRVKDEIAPPEEISGGTTWKWMALDGGVLYALVGGKDNPPPPRRRGDLSGPLYAMKQHAAGKTFLAIDSKTKRILWSHKESEPVQGCWIGMRNQRIYFFRPGAALVCLDGQTGKVRWRKTPSNAAALFDGIEFDQRQSIRRMAYLLCGKGEVFLMGLSHTIAVAAETGELLWKLPAGKEGGHTALHLLLRDDGLYICGGANKGKYDPSSGKHLGGAPAGRGCAILTGSADSIFSRGSRTFLGDSSKVQAQSFTLIRPSCTEGVTVSEGHLYWWPSWCTCSYSLYGAVALGPAGDFDFQQAGTDEQRLETAVGNAKVASFEHVQQDWPTFRGDSARRCISTAKVADEGKTLWSYRRATSGETTAPVAAGGLVFFSGSDGIVHAVDAATGKRRWKAYTGGAVRFPPTVADGRVFVGSGDGWAYAFEAATGRRLWRFRAAPVDRKIPVYGRLLSTWPAASGVVVDGGKAYVAAGIAHYDGTHVYALDAATGRIRWQNNKTGNIWYGHGVSVLGHLLLNNDKLYLASGKHYSPAIFDARDGTFSKQSVRSTGSPRGWELSLVEGEVKAGGLPLYVPPDFPVGRGGLGQQTFVFPAGDDKLVWQAGKVSCFPRSFNVASWLAQRRSGASETSLRWTINNPDAVAVAVTANAVIVAEGKPPKRFGTRRPSKPPRTQLLAFRLNNGQPLWQVPLPAAPVRWGLAIDRDGRILVTLDDGQLIVIGRPS